MRSTVPAQGASRAAHAATTATSNTRTVRRNIDSPRAERARAPGALEDGIEPRPIGDFRVAVAQEGERLGVVLLRLLRERLAVDRARHLGRAGRDRLCVRDRPREEDAADLVAQERQQRRLEAL